MTEGDTQHPDKVNVWAGTVGQQIIGSIFFEKNLIGTRYVEFLEEGLVSNLAILFPNPVEADSNSK